MSQNLILLYQKDQAARLCPGFGTGSYIFLNSNLLKTSRQKRRFKYEGCRN
ncbi:hypothetical protein LEP1GSC179_1522 [Leptospira santarosai str. MOR084]|uniref:Uncharacterized protein n=1 Tax=Leptospira santarosai str. MOR084 TaxID=1049984 RepID=A0A0E2BH62_9LEPT|nr:hypothetical protein LEP1GSC179_1522 [Leptospira santarosai str. MOR084]